LTLGTPLDRMIFEVLIMSYVVGGPVFHRGTDAISVATRKRRSGRARRLAHALPRSWRAGA
jgi:hypothetical protein